MSDVGKLLLLGRDYGSYGTLAATAVGGRGAVAISVGSDENSPSNQFKTDPAVRNEDALCIMEAHEWAGFAVADAHYGPESSQLVIERIHVAWSMSKPEGPADLGRLAMSLCDGPAATTESETTMLIVIFDRRTNTGFGLSYGDSSFAVVGPDTTPETINPRFPDYVRTSSKSSMMQGHHFSFSAQPGDVLLTYTDGIDECHYRKPEQSVQPSHIARIAANASYDPLTIATETTQLALAGVDGFPGGQDNIAIIASSVGAPLGEAS